MNTRILPLLAALLILPSAARAHDFTRPDGSTISGEITAVASDAVHITMADKRNIQVPLAMLAQPDQDHFHQWAVQNHKHALGITGAEKRVGGQKKDKKLSNSRGQSLEGHTQDWAFQITVLNKASFTTPALSAEIQLWVDPSGKSGPNAATTATMQIPALKPGGTHVFDTPTVELATVRPPPGFSFTNGHNEMHKHRLHGFTAKLEAKGSAVWVHESKPGLLGVSIQTGRSTLTATFGKGGPAYSGPPTGLAAALAGSMKGSVTFSSPAP